MERSAVEILTSLNDAQDNLATVELAIMYLRGLHPDCKNPAICMDKALTMFRNIIDRGYDNHLLILRFALNHASLLGLSARYTQEQLDMLNLATLEYGASKHNDISICLLANIYAHGSSVVPMDVRRAMTMHSELPHEHWCIAYTGKDLYTL